MNEKEYKEWLKYLFDRDESKGDWTILDENNYYEPSEESIVYFFTRMFDHFKSDVSHFSDWQIANGLNYIFTTSEFTFAIREGEIDLDLRLAAIRSIKNLYTSCFEDRCLPVLGHLNEKGNSLNDLCYMLWDTTQLSYCSEENPDADAIYQSICSVMKHSLNSSNIACVEGGLHGLGHIVSGFPEAASIIGDFITHNNGVDKRVLKYANQAKTGRIL